MRGCIIEAENQVLGEEVAVVGTDYKLEYSSATTPGRRANYQFEVDIPAPYWGEMPPSATYCVPGREPQCQAGTAGWDCVQGRVPECQITPYPGFRVDSRVTATVAGAEFVATSSELPLNQTGRARFEWNGRDAYGRALQGEQPVSVQTCYEYPAVLYADDAGLQSAWAQPSLTGATLVTRIVGSMSEVFELCVTTSGRVGGWDARAAGLGGWTLSPNHMLDVPNRTVYRGDRGIQRVDDLSRYTARYVVGTGRLGISGDRATVVSDGIPASALDLNVSTGLAIGADGSIYFSDPARGIIGQVTPDGIFHIFAGNQNRNGSDADGVLAIQANLVYPSGLAFGNDGSLYYADADTNRIRRIAPDGRVYTIAGAYLGGRIGYTEDGAVATSALLGLDRRTTIAVSPDGTVFFAEPTNHRIRKVGPDGILRTAAGSGPAAPNLATYGAYSGDGGPALQARLNTPQGVSIGPDGSLYIADSCNQRVRKVTPDGTITTIAGSGYDCRAGWPASGGDGGPATAAGLGYPFFSVAVAPDSSLFIADYALRSIRRINPFGTIDTVAGNGFMGDPGSPGCHADDCPAVATGVGSVEAVATGPDGSVYALLGSNAFRIVRLTSTLAKKQMSVDNIVVPSPDGSEVYVFDARGRHLRTLDAISNAALATFGYDAAGHLASITDRSGNVTGIERDAQGQPSSILGPYGQRTTLAVDSSGYLSAITNPNSETLKLAHTAAIPSDSLTGGLLTQFTDARGGSSVYEYDRDGFLTKDTRADGSWQSFSRSGSFDSPKVTLTTAMGRTTTLGIATSVARDGETRTAVNPAGLSSQTTRNPDHSQTVTLPDGTVETQSSLPDPRFGIQAAYASSRTTKLPSGLTRSETTSRTATLSNPLDPLSLSSLLESTTVNGRTSQSTYDAVARRTTLTSPAGRVTTLDYDALGRVVTVSPPGVQPIQTHYDARGRVDSTTQGTRVTSMSYSSNGWLDRLIDPALHATSFAYDPAGRPVSETLPDLSVVATGYDANGNTTSVTPPSRPAHTFSFTAADQESLYSPPGGASFATRTTYDADQHVSRVSRPDGDYISPTYDSAGRLAAFTTSRVTNTYSYSPTSGQLTGIDTFDGVGLRYAYDGSLLTDVSWSGPVQGGVHKTYDSSFRLASESVTGGQTINFGYDNDDLLTSAGAMTITRDPATGFVTGTALGAISESRTYDAFGAEQTYTVTANSATLYSVNYGTRDALGRIVNKTETIQGTTHVYGYTYDSNGRLTDVTTDGNATSHYEYDANGNRLAGPGLTASPVYDSQDRLLSYGNCTYTYKNDGALQTKTCPDGTTTYDYDAFGNLRGVTLPSGTAITYLIDGQNRRVGKKVNGTLVEGFLYSDDMERVEWVDGTGAIKGQFVFALHQHVPDYMTKAGVTYRLVYDQVGSVRLVVDPSGAVTERVDYDEFGNVLADSAPGLQPFGFAGGLRDLDTILTRFGARDYDPVPGRWTAKDPLRFGGADTDLYGYAGVEPINRMDPSGLLPRSKLPWQARDCKPDERARCEAQCAGRGVESCKVNQTWRFIRQTDKDGVIKTSYGWVDGPMSCSCNDDQPPPSPSCSQNCAKVLMWVAAAGTFVWACLQAAPAIP